MAIKGTSIELTDVTFIPHFNSWKRLYPKHTYPLVEFTPYEKGPTYRYKTWYMVTRSY